MEIFTCLCLATWQSRFCIKMRALINKEKHWPLINAEPSFLCGSTPRSLDNFKSASIVYLHGLVCSPVMGAQANTQSYSLFCQALSQLNTNTETWLGEPQGLGLMTNKLSVRTNISAPQMKYRFSPSQKLIGNRWGCVCLYACVQSCCLDHVIWQKQRKVSRMSLIEWCFVEECPSREKVASSFFFFMFVLLAW